ncbi:MAG: 3-deoxy-7-phosphoheptulonate synthase [Legionellaceae bacterium]|nr:3-deoxy-7-phosphoheptulonate synthase [Legionellaceae bacterium]
MNYVKIKELISSEDLIKQRPLSTENALSILQHRKEIKAILDGRDNRKLIIVGPCSAWPKEAVIEYANRLAMLNTRVKHALKIVMRVYPQKPRTLLGWSGAVFQPDPFTPVDINEGMQYTRDMIMRVIELDLPVAAEALYTHFQDCYLELLSWVAIGARSSENQEHRVFASAVDIPIGMKNPTHGSINIALNSVIAAQNPHPAIFNGYESRTLGNPYAHLVLRGGDNKPNFSNENLDEVNQIIKKHPIMNPAVIIDVNHDNSIIDDVRDYRQQPESIFRILESLSKRSELENLVKGFMIESFIKDGNQALDQVSPSTIDLGGLSLTDPCIGWEGTERLILSLALVP